jgi:hypothetical protein
MEYECGLTGLIRKGYKFDIIIIMLINQLLNKKNKIFYVSFMNDYDVYICCYCSAKKRLLVSCTTNVIEKNKILLDRRRFGWMKNDDYIE